MVYIFSYERQGHKIKLLGDTSTKQKELLHRTESQTVKLLASGGCCCANITRDQKGVHSWLLNTKPPSSV